jgi:membrane protein DedA with SNARE-associated domain
MTDIELFVSQYGVLAVFFGSAVEGETFALTGGLLAHRSLMPFWLVATAASAGSFMADQALFLVGRHCRERQWVRAFIARPVFAWAMTTLERHQTAFILGFRFFLGMRTVSPVAIGASDVSSGRFVLLNALAAVVWGLSFTGAGYLFGQGIESLLGHHAQVEHILVGGAIMLVISGAFAWLLKRRLAAQNGRKTLRRAPT